MQLTKKSGSWIPRLERMVQSRGLCPFEKKVLLTLIGFIIQPNKVRIISYMILLRWSKDWLWDTISEHDFGCNI